MMYDDSYLRFDMQSQVAPTCSLIMYHFCMQHPNVSLERYVVTGAEDMRDIPDNSVDAVVSTLVLCSCDKVQEVYGEICRVLVPVCSYCSCSVFSRVFDLRRYHDDNNQLNRCICRAESFTTWNMLSMTSLFP